MTRLPLLIVLTLATTGCGSSSKPTPASPVDSTSTVRGSDGDPKKGDPKKGDSGPKNEPRENAPDKGPSTQNQSNGDPNTTRDRESGRPHVQIDSVIREKARQFSLNEQAKREQAGNYLDGQGETAISQLIALMSDKDVETRRGAAFYLLGNFAPQNDALVAAFVAALSDEDRAVRHIALQSVRSLPEKAAVQALPALARMLDSKTEQESNRQAAASLLASLEAHTELVMPALTNAALTDPSQRVRMASIRTIRRIGTAEQALPVLEEALTSDRSALVRRTTARQLAQVGSEALPIADSMCKAFEDTDDAVRTTVTDALIALGDPVVPIVAKHLGSPNAATRENALFVLGKMGPKAGSVTEEVKKLLQDPVPEVRELAALVLKRLQGP